MYKTKYTRDRVNRIKCNAVSDYIKEKHGIDCPAEDIVITPGAKQGLPILFLITTMPGDEVILLAPSWASYEPMLKFIGATPIHVPVNKETFHPDLDAIRNAINEKTK